MRVKSRSALNSAIASGRLKDQTGKSHKRFATVCHVKKGSPLLLYNAWDVGFSGKLLAEAGARAIATSRWSVAEAQGYRDGAELSRSR